MGAEPWNYFTKYDDDIQRALDLLRDEVFTAGEFRYADEGPRTIDEALEIADADGTASILDILEISEEPDFCCAAPFSSSQLSTYFGSDQPTREDVERAEDHWEEMERGQARYAVVYENGTPSELYFAGYSFDKH